ncbi:hypothetical protein JHN55_25235 [Streptomyces sp. MBT56]|uniref:hypothetical protein n=1 Tax=unclassified Streptomyces TaxID=2593676 RepID=UPI0019097FA7|nr:MULTISPECIES: hypothetical protein [unclassified Streptomyces]MBK3559769.1 hypothetical protein [Streptomyces sp. MBT56]MBK3601289.1 hypothetical protein [Streptomyces sp. MBT54]MBK3615264.1 hypothetical protein [Streptomyces sp. MBT98]
MNHFYVERRPTTGTTQCFEDLAFHLQLRYNLGTTVVVAERPRVYASMLARAWTKVDRQLQRELASRLNQARGPYLREDKRKEHIVFVAAGTAKANVVPETAAVIFVAPDTLAGLPTSYMTAYIVDAPPEAQQRVLEERLMPNGLLVEYVLD